MAESKKPNILIFVPHDLGQHLGCYGMDTVDTENIDRLASEGVRFENSFCTAPQCSPSRASIFTGRYPHSNGVMGLTHDGFAWDLHDTERHLSGILSEHGWHSTLAGGAHETRKPERMGFDQILPAEDELGDACVDFLSGEKGHSRPFFLEIQMGFTHRSRIGFGSKPYDEKGVEVPDYLVDDPSCQEDLAYFQGAVNKQDRFVGRILNALEESGLEGETMVIFTADHGAPFPRAKCSVYDPGLEVPLIVKWPEGPWKPGNVYKPLVSNVDYLPTLLDLLNLHLPKNVQGKSHAPLLSGDRDDYSPREEIFGEMTYHDYYDPRRCIRTEEYKLIVNFSMAHSFMDPSQSWERKCRTVQPENPPYAYHPLLELYDLNDDPLEFENLVGKDSHQELLEDLIKRLDVWMEDTEDSLLEGVPLSPTHKEALQALGDRLFE